MSDQELRISRREFLRVAGVAGAVPLFAAGKALAADAVTIPTRPFGRSGVRVPILSLGGMFDVPGNQLLLRQALKMGVSYWDTADCYEGGLSESGFGRFFKKYPDDRKKVFLVSKADERDPAGMTRLLERSLERLKTDYIDLYLAHNIGDIDEVNLVATRQWAEKMKAEGRIRLFGFSTHRNVARTVRPAADLDWIDGIMLAYNYRTMNTPDLKAAVGTCHGAGIGLTAMKFRGFGPIPGRALTGKKLVEGFRKKGFTEDQAKLKAVWENPKISTMCALMKNMSTLKSFVAAARDRQKLSADDRGVLDAHARETRGGYCAGCANICEAAVDGNVPVSDVMRYLMYHHGYGETEKARGLFHAMDAATRRHMTGLDYGEAERRCPHGLPIARLMHEAVRVLA
ncbi:MAG: aldo/keto reductase [Deltaproteobacteria bacterium]|nr:aldo/keto reductase [Deltaproteobacteria bacterium]